ncbi:leucine-rich repeat-containing protein [Lasius niger]|uniref:Leucine-rich repeat-containing protein n=1 Tax=Lasius niger TaxID=67767 RepID=A0A0J7L3F8_LASNI|nr:leucine-rich repeat-containing protein [Lasius niger]
MSNRRRADDFTNSLKSFHQTIREETQNSIVSQRELEDKSDINSIIRQCKSDNHSYQRNNESRASTIIAGNLGSQQYISSDPYEVVEDNITCNDNQSLLRDISDETSYLPLKPDLNKCINLFRDEHLSKENYTFQEYSNLDSMLPEIRVHKDIDPQYLNKNKTVKVQCDLIRDRAYAMSANSLEDVISRKKQDVTNKELRRSKSCSMLNSNLKRDTNHNIKASHFFVASTNTATRKNSHEKTDITTLFDALSLAEPFILPNKKINSHSTEDQKCDSTNSKTSSKEQLNSPELKTFLHSLEYQKPLKETSVQERLLRRLSANFYNSPETFTERLLTIIEESVISNDSCAQLEYPEVSLCRLSEELRKIIGCKFIEDETMPEWPRSPNMSKSICKRQRSQESKSSSRKSLNAFASRDKGLCLATPPISPRRNIKSPKKICRRMSKNISYNMKSLLHDNTSTFESLEAFCEIFYADENRAVPREKNPLQSPLQNINSILRLCENQMASLENSPDIREQLRKAQTFTSDLPNQHDNKVPEAQNLQYRLLTHEKRNKTDSKEVPDTFQQWTGRNKSYEMIDDLENTLMYEIAKKRQRCLDTAKVMMEIDTNSEPVEAQQIFPNIISEPPPTSDVKFIETLMSVKRYQEYLEEQKPILHLLRAESCSAPRTPRTPDKKYIQKKEISREDFGTRRLGDKIKIATLEVPKLSTMRKKSKSPSSPKCSSSNIVVSKPKLFVTPGKSPINKSCKIKRTYFPNLVGGMKNKEKKLSPHPKNIYQQIDNYDHVVSPVGMYIKGTDPYLIKNLRPKTDEKLLTPRKKQIMRSSGPKLKFQLSPKRPKKTMTRTAVGDENNENIADNFPHPKVHYKLPSHVRTIKETENRKVGNRVNELLRSTQDKVMIRHKDRIKSVQTDCLKQPEILYDSAEGSAHVEQTARKTCFSRVQKD